MIERRYTETDRAVLYRFYDKQGEPVLDEDGYPTGRIEHKVPPPAPTHRRSPIEVHTSARTVGWAPFVAGAAGGLLLEGIARLFT